jgi:predicted RNA binding protein YcfA (HicA-like mRNA interferase family)
MRLHPVSRRNLIRRFRELGWDGPHSGGRHEYMVKDDAQIPIPNPHTGADIGVNLLSKILREADISRDEWLNE